MAVAQGAFNCTYASIDTISNLSFGTEIKIDFKKDELDTLTSKIDRILFVNEDIVKLIINNNTFEFKESWNIYPDAFDLREQLLIGIRNKYIIDKMFLNGLENDSLIVEIGIYEKNYKQNYCTYKIKIPLSIVKGILIYDKEYFDKTKRIPQSKTE